MKVVVLAGVVLSVLMGSCATTPAAHLRVDGSSPAAFDASWQKLVASLSPNQRSQLDMAVLLIGATKWRAGGPDSFGPATLRGELDGKDYEDILEAAQATGTRVQSIQRPAGTT